VGKAYFTWTISMNNDFAIFNNGVKWRGINDGRR
jgi:hypothetical protein